VAAIVKLDISQLDRQALEMHVRQLKSRGAMLVAERVETPEEMEMCRAIGFDLFQGYFLARPAIMKRSRAPEGNRLAALQTLSALNSPAMTLDQLEGVVSRDVTLGYRLVRVINSAQYALPGRIESLRQAILYLGRDRIRDWVTLLVLSGQNAKPGDLLITGLVRARMCEQLGTVIDPPKAHVFFTAGLFSILDAVFDMPMGQLVESLSLAPEIGCALTERRGSIGGVLEACIAHERAQWTQAEYTGLTSAQIGAAYLDALRWASSMGSAMAGAIVS
jgi:EAL and modified HD-GYP domain-containing signal transduction protein